MNDTDSSALQSGMQRAGPGARDPFEGAPSFSIAHRLYRVLWATTWLLLAAWTPPAMRHWRLMLLRCFGARVSMKAQVYASARVWYPRHLIMEDHATLGPGVTCYSMASIRVGRYAVVSQRAHLCTGSHDIHQPSFQIQARPIEIGAYAWICAEAFVGPGVMVGDGAVLGARAAAFRDLSAWTVYLGNPATSVRSRPSFSRSS